MVNIKELEGALDDLDVGSLIITQSPLFGDLCDSGVEMQLTARVKTPTEETFKFKLTYLSVRVGDMRVVRRDGVVTAEVQP